MSTNLQQAREIRNQSPWRVAVPALHATLLALSAYAHEETEPEGTFFERFGDYNDLTGYLAIGLLVVPSLVALVKAFAKIERIQSILGLFDKILNGKDRLVERLSLSEETRSGISDLLEVCQRSIVSSASHIPPEEIAKSNLRVTLFFHDSQSKKLFQVARHRWDGQRDITATEVREGTCAVGHAWTRRRPYELAGVLGSGALTECGLSQDEVAAHVLRDRALFAAVPIFASADGQTPYVTHQYPPNSPIAVVAFDSAVVNALPPNWWDPLARDVFPALAKVVERSSSTTHARSRAVPLAKR